MNDGDPHLCDQRPGGSSDRLEAPHTLVPNRNTREPSEHYTGPAVPTSCHNKEQRLRSFSGHSGSIGVVVLQDTDLTVQRYNACTGRFTRGSFPGDVHLIQQGGG